MLFFKEREAMQPALGDIPSNPNPFYPGVAQSDLARLAWDQEDEGLNPSIRTTFT